LGEPGPHRLPSVARCRGAAVTSLLAVPQGTSAANRRTVFPATERKNEHANIDWRFRGITRMLAPFSHRTTSFKVTSQIALFPRHSPAPSSRQSLTRRRRSARTEIALLLRRIVPTRVYPQVSLLFTHESMLTGFTWHLVIVTM
jgi:hypothetical protein